MSRETDHLKQYMTDSTVRFVVTATTGEYRSAKDPCHPHAPGSYHCRTGTNGPGLALDLAQSFGGPPDSPGLLAIRNAFAPVEHQLAELIYAGPGHPPCIKDGRPFAYDAKTMQGHHNHVHVAVERGVFLTWPTPTTPGAAMATFPDAVDACIVPGSTDRDNPPIWLLKADGGIITFNGAAFHGAYPGLPPAARNNPDRRFVKIDPEPDGGGYVLLANDGAHYRFR